MKRHVLTVSATLAAFAIGCGPADGRQDFGDLDPGAIVDDEPLAIDVDGPVPEESGEPLPLVIAGVTVEDSIRAGCSTSSVRGLSEQIIAQMNCITPNLVAEVPSRSNFSKTAATFPFMQTPARNALVSALDANPGRDLRVNSMFRTVAQQYLLYRWSQSKSCGIGLAARPGRSNHESGLAIDTSQYSAWRTSLETRGYAWFGSRDRVHFDYRGAGAKDLRGVDVKAFQMLWNANNPSDKITADGIYGTQTGNRLSLAPAGGFVIGSTCQAPEPPAPEPPPEPEPPPAPEPPDQANEGRVIGVVWDLSTSSTPTDGLRIPGAIVTAGGIEAAARAGDAFWQLEIGQGERGLSASAPGYQTATSSVLVTAGQDSWASIGLWPATARTSLEVHVTTSGGAPLENAVVYVAEAGYALSDAGGRAELDVDGTVEFLVYLEGYEGVSVTAEAAESPLTVALDTASSGGSTGRLQGVVWDGSLATSAATSSGARLAGAIVLCSSGQMVRTRAGDGYWWLDVPAGTSTFTVLAAGFEPVSFERLLANGTSDWGSVGLTPSG